MSLRYWLGALLGLFLVGCATKPVSLPSNLEQPTKRNKVSLKSKGKLVLRQKIRKNMRPKPCQDFSRRFKVILTQVGSGTRFPMHASCRKDKSSLLVYPRKFLLPGDYYVEIERKQSWRYFYGKPRLMVRYLNPDFDSETDQVLTGANTAAKGNKIEGEINYSNGDRTDWYQIDGENSMVTLTLLGQNRSRDLSAAVYRSIPGVPKGRKLAVLKHGKSKSFRLGKSNLYLKMRGKTYSGAANYTVLRKDFPITRVVSVPVIDSYRVSDSTSMLLLESVEGLKVKDLLSVRGKKLNGKSVSLGQCLITSVEDGQASCRLPKVPKVNIVELTAHARVDG